MVDDRRKNREKDDEMWDEHSREQSDRNYIVGESMSNPWNNTKNPNWRNHIMNQGYRLEMINDPQRVEKRNQVSDNNYNKELLDKDKKV